MITWPNESETASDRLERVPRERVNRSADLIDLTRALAARGAIPVTLPPYMTGQRDLAPDQSHRNRMPLAWHLRRLRFQGRPIEWDVAGLWSLILVCLAIELCGLWMLAGAIVEFIAGVLR